MVVIRRLWGGRLKESVIYKSATWKQFIFSHVIFLFLYVDKHAKWFPKMLLKFKLYRNEIIYWGIKMN